MATSLKPSQTRSITLESHQALFLKDLITRTLATLVNHKDVDEHLTKRETDVAVKDLCDLYAKIALLDPEFK